MLFRLNLAVGLSHYGMCSAPLVQCHIIGLEITAVYLTKEITRSSSIFCETSPVDVQRLGRSSFTNLGKGCVVPILRAVATISGMSIADLILELADVQNGRSRDVIVVASG